jgi:hypothetical protein
VLPLCVPRHRYSRPHDGRAATGAPLLLWPPRRSHAGGPAAGC